MDKKSKFFFIIIALSVVISIIATYWRIMIKKDYIIKAQANCDPVTERCFVWQCDFNSLVDGEKCVGDSEKDIFYYKIVKRNASKIPLCDPVDESCQALVCEDDEPECEVIFCDDENKLEQGVECSQ